MTMKLLAVNLAKIEHINLLRQDQNHKGLNPTEFEHQKAPAIGLFCCSFVDLQTSNPLGMV